MGQAGEAPQDDRVRPSARVARDCAGAHQPVSRAFRQRGRSHTLSRAVSRQHVFSGDCHHPDVVHASHPRRSGKYLDYDQCSLRTHRRAGDLLLPCGRPRGVSRRPSLLPLHSGNRLANRQPRLLLPGIFSVREVYAQLEVSFCHYVEHHPNEPAEPFGCDFLSSMEQEGGHTGHRLSARRAGVAIRLCDHDEHAAEHPDESAHTAQHRGNRDGDHDMLPDIWSEHGKEHGHVGQCVPGCESVGAARRCRAI
mmetsp:Transcript_14416/g.33044  ORF Transcript_14416/g.33044 Transcript_14416/m.33044 type:complete len:252 (+) Transcript_14416:526-1281(+)